MATTAREFLVDVRSFGAKGDGSTNDTAALQAAIDKTSQEGSTLFFPRGTYTAGTLYLRDNTTLHLGRGAVLKGITDASAYDFVEPALGSRMDTRAWRAFLYAANVENLTIEGDGTIDGSGGCEAFQGFPSNSRERPYGLHFVKCRNIIVRGITMRNSAFWMQRYFGCEDLRVSDITVFNHSNLNNDGIDIDGCKRVFVSNCRIDSSDDALCIKSEGALISEDVVVTNCILSSSASAIKLGTGSVGGYRRITINNCIVRPIMPEKSRHEMGLTGGLMGIDLGNVDGGVLEDVVVSNVVIDGVETPIFIRLGKRLSRADNLAGGVWEDAPEVVEGRSDTITVTNVTARNVGPIACAIHGYPGNPVRNVTLSNINIHHSRPGTENRSPEEIDENAAGYPFNRMFGSNLPAFGFYARHVSGLTMRGIRLFGDKEDSRSACVFDDVEELQLRNMVIDAPGAQQPTIQYSNCRDVKEVDVRRLEKSEQ